MNETEKVKDYLKSNGYDDNAIPGIMGNMVQGDYACMEVAGIESMTNCDPPAVGYPLNQ